MKYEVICLSLSGTGNRILRAGDVVNESDLVGNPTRLVEGGFIKKAGNKSTEKTDSKDEGKKPSQMNKGELQAELKKLFPDNPELLEGTNKDLAKMVVGGRDGTFKPEAKDDDGDVDELKELQEKYLGLNPEGDVEGMTKEELVEEIKDDLEVKYVQLEGKEPEEIYSKWDIAILETKIAELENPE